MPIDRKAGIIAWKERKNAPDIYVVRCPASDESWMRQVADLAIVQNRHWISFRTAAITIALCRRHRPDTAPPA